MRYVLIFFLLISQFAANAQKVSLVIPNMHKGRISQAAFHPSGKMLMTLSSDDGTIMLWDIPSLLLLSEFQHPGNEVYFGAYFSRNGKYLLFTAFDSVRIYNCYSGAYVTSIPGDLTSGSLKTEVYFTDIHDKFILTRLSDTTFHLTELATGMVRRKFSTTSRTASVELNSAGTQVAVEKGNMMVKYDILYGKTSAISKSRYDSLKNLELSALKGLDLQSADVVSPDRKMIFNKDSFVLKDVSGKFINSFSKNDTYYTKMTLTSSGKLWHDPGHLWDLETNRLLGSSVPEPPTVQSGRMVSYNENGSTLLIIDTITGKEIWRIPFTVEKIGVSPDGKNAYYGNDTLAFSYPLNGSGAAIPLFGNAIQQLDWTDLRSSKTFLSKDGKTEIRQDPEDPYRFQIFRDGDMRISFQPNQLFYDRLSPDGSLLYLTDADEISYLGTTMHLIFDVNAKMLLHAIKPDSIIGKHMFGNVVFTPDSKKIVFASNVETRIYDVATGKHMHNIPGQLIGHITNSSFSPDGKYILTSGYADLGVFEVATGKEFKKFPTNGYLIESAIFGTDGNTVFSFHRNNSIRRWDLSTGQLLCTFFVTESNDYMVINPEGYYMSSPGAAKSLYYITDSLKKIGFEQLDVKFNRPDKVLQTIGTADTSLIYSFRKAYDKRIKKLGIDTTSFTDGFGLPEADFANRGSINSEQTKNTVTLRISAKDKTFNLERFNVWVNRSPLFGMNGISLRTKHTLSFDTTITIELTAGKNEIETSVININGMESYRMPLVVYYKNARREVEKLHFIGIGINQYAQKGHDLNWSVRDIRELAKGLAEKYGDRLQVDTLFDENVTVSNVTALKKRLSATAINDIVILAYSGHGLLSSDFDYYLSTFAVDFDKPEINGLSYEAFESLLDGIPARKKLVLIDACHSGEVDKEEMAKYNMVERSIEDSGTKSGRKPVLREAKLGMQNSFELMQQLFVNVSRSTGATVISAAGGLQFAQEKSDLENGVFTFSILEFMRSHSTATVTELKNYVNKRVPELTGGMQVPTTRTESLVVDWRVW